MDTFSHGEVFHTLAELGNHKHDLCHLQWPHCLLDVLVEGHYTVVMPLTFLGFNLRPEIVVQGVRVR